MTELQLTVTQLPILKATDGRWAPRRLYAEGNLGLLELPRVSISGPRWASMKGLERTEELARRLAEAGVAVVSGLAKGIDAAAHWAAIRAGGTTIAVLGTPLDEVSPRRNEALQRVIAREHLVVSQFAPGSDVTSWNFTQRNRTIALMSHACVITDACATSRGTQVQGWEALRLGRPLFIAADVIADAALAWPRRMCRKGARVLTDKRFAELLEAAGAA